MNKYLCILIALGLSLLPASAGANTAEATAAIIFSGTSTLHDFEGTVISKPFTVTAEEDADSGAVRVSATAVLNVQDMTTDHKKRDKNMFKMLEQETFTLISGSLHDAVLPTTGTTTATLRLKIRDVEQDVEVALSDYKRTGDQVSCTMAFPVSLKAFNLQRPSVLGLIRVGDTVQIKCTIQGRLSSQPEKK